jgi:antitoxin CptB
VAADSPGTGEDASQRLRMLEWRCRRGMKELDLLLLRHLRGNLVNGTSAEVEAFAGFLELPDPQIARYLLAGELPADPEQAAICRALLSSN